MVSQRKLKIAKKKTEEGKRKKIKNRIKTDLQKANNTRMEEKRSLLIDGRI